MVPSTARTGSVRKDRLELVILQHRENIAWSDVFDPIRTVYVNAPHADELTPPSTARRPPFNVGREQSPMLRHIIEKYDTLAERTVFMHGSLPTCGYFAENAHHLMTNVSALDYLSEPLAHATSDGPQLFMPLTMRTTHDMKLWALRSSFAELPATESHKKRALRPGERALAHDSTLQVRACMGGKLTRCALVCMCMWACGVLTCGVWCVCVPVSVCPHSRPAPQGRRETGRDGQLAQLGAREL